MPLIPFDPMTENFLLVPPKDFATQGQGDGGLVYSATSTQAQSDAQNMRFNDRGSAWRSGTLIAVSSVTVDIDLGAPALIDSFFWRWNNLQIPDGWKFEGYTGAPGVGSPIIELGPGLDAIVRTDDTVTGKYIDENLRLRFNHSPVRFAPTMLQGIRGIFDTTSGNGPDDFLEIFSAFAGLSVDIKHCLSKNNSTFNPLSKVIVSAGGGGSSEPRMPTKSQTVPLDFLLQSDEGQLINWTGLDDIAHPGFIWGKPLEPDTFKYSGFFGGLTGKVGYERRSGEVSTQKTMTINEKGFR